MAVFMYFIVIMYSLKTVLLEKGTLLRVDVCILKYNFDVHVPLH